MAKLGEVTVAAGGVEQPCERCMDGWGVRQVEVEYEQGEQPFDASVELSTDDLERLVSEWLARVSGVPVPVRRTARWVWVEGENGPRLSMSVERAGNVVRFGGRS